MRLATYLSGAGTACLAAIDPAESRLLDLQSAHQRANGTTSPWLSSMLDLIDSGDAGLALARGLVEIWPESSCRSLSDVRLLAPIPEPRSIRDCLVFEEHLINVSRSWTEMTGRPAAPISPHWYERPTYAKGNRFSVIGTDTDVVWPSYCKVLDYECELACVIGRRGRDIGEAEAGGYIFGFMAFNDFSARDLQIIERPMGMGPMKSKDFDTGNALGPWIVTADEIGDPQNLKMEVRVNGERRGGGTTANMHHSFARIVSFISTDETLHPGEVIASGTVGTGCGLEIQRFLKPGDVVEIEIERIGVLRNRIVAVERATH